MKELVRERKGIESGKRKGRRRRERKGRGKKKVGRKKEGGKGSRREKEGRGRRVMGRGKGRGIGKENETKEEAWRKGREIEEGMGGKREKREKEVEVKGGGLGKRDREGEGKGGRGKGGKRRSRSGKQGCGSLQRQCLGSFAQVSLRNVLTQLRPHRTRWEPGAPSDSFTELVLLKTCAQIRYLGKEELAEMWCAMCKGGS